MKIKYLIIVTFSLLISYQVNAGDVFDLVIAKDGSGDYKNLSQALIFLSSSSTRKLIYVKNGVYEEQVRFTQKNFSLIGESRDSVIFTYDLHVGDNKGSSTSSCGTFIVSSDNFYCENITFENSAGAVGQAVALMPTGNNQVFNNCKMLGYQDTYYANGGKQYNYNCYIDGATDFIFGESTAVFDSCTVLCKSGGQYLTAPGDTKLTSTQDNGSTMLHGLFFTNCLIKKGTGVSAGSYFLGRPWKDFSSTIFKNCTLEDHIKSAGWYAWDATTSTVYVAEYKSVNTEGSLVDVSGRVDWSYQIPDSIAEKYYTLDYFFSAGGEVWDAKSTLKALDAPANVAVNSYTVSWDAVNNAKGYVIIRNDSTIGFAETTSFTDETVNTGIENVYKVKSVNSTYGNLSVASNEVTVAASGFQETTQDKLAYFISSNILYVSSVSDIQIYNVAGTLIKSATDVRQLDLNGYKGKSLICLITDAFGNVKSSKIIL